MNPHDYFEQRIDRLDLALFAAIPTQSHDGDRKSWLAVQRAVRRLTPGYTYLEIGSHLGGSIQQHLLDPKCLSIISVDKRPLEQPDDRGQTFQYEGNSTERMLSNLRSVAPGRVGILTCFDADTRGMDPGAVKQPPHLCFIDGEHTRPAVLSDFEFCLRVGAPDVAICFHDDAVIYPALEEILCSLADRAVPHIALKLGGDTFGIFLRGCRVPDDDLVKGIGSDGRKWLRKRKAARFAEQTVPNWLLPIVRPVGSWLLGR
jgi:hypothetical protein